MSKNIERYDLSEKLNSLSVLLDTYHAWYAAILRAAFNPKKSANPSLSPMPELFNGSLVSLSGFDGASDEHGDVAALREQHKALQLLAHELLKGHDWESEATENFLTAFRSFVHVFQKTCQVLIIEEWGLDVLTGLKNKQSMLEAMKQELERLGRDGQVFSLAYVRIDDFVNAKGTLGYEEYRSVIQAAAKIIIQSLRTFDEAYHLGGGEFVLSMKQADIYGGQRALERLRDILEKSGYSYVINGENKKMTMSCCVAEPLPEQDIPLLLKNLKSDLDSAPNHDGRSVLAYNEISPLQSFIKSGHKNQY